MSSDSVDSVVPSSRNPFNLFPMRLKGMWNGVVRRPWQYVLGATFLLLVYWGVFEITRRGVRFIENLPILGLIDVREAVLQRSLETLFLVLMFGVAFSVLTTAIHTLYSSDDLPFLLALPVPPVRVFYLKVVETYLNAALLPALFTVPILLGLGIEKGASWFFYPIALAAVLSLYAIPVALGCFIALILMRIAPAGRVKEISTGLSVILAAALIFGLRFLRPEQLATMSPEALVQTLRRFASFELSWSPTTWTSQAVWGALENRVTLGAFFLALISIILLIIIAQIASFAYRAGWIRALDAGAPKLDPRAKPAPLWEKFLQRFGQRGAIIAKDVRLLLRDPTQWSQLLVLLAMAGVYLVSVGSAVVEGAEESQRYRDAVGMLNIAFMGFMLGGIGIRMAYPIVSLEAEGFWLLKTGPLKSHDIVMSKFWNTLPVMAILGAGLGIAAALMIDVSATLRFVSPIAGLSAAIVTTGLGVGLGAAFPRFDANTPSEIPMAAGGLLYMGLSLVYAVLMTLILAYPAYTAIASPNTFFWRYPLGWGVLAAIVLLTFLWTALPLLIGSRKLANWEPGAS